MKERPAGPVTLTFLDSKGQITKTFSSDAKAEASEQAFGPGATAPPTANAGGNRFIWDMRYADARGVPGFTLVSLTGPRVAPGRYQVQLAMDGKTVTQSFDVLKDPRVQVSQTDLDEQLELLLKIRDKLSQCHDAVNDIRSLRQQIDGVLKAREGKSGAARIAEAARAIHDKLWRMEDELIQYRARGGQDLWNFPIRLNNKLASLAGFVSRADAPPTQQQVEVYTVLAAGVDQQVAKLRELVRTDLVAFNRLSKSSIAVKALPTT